MNFDDYGDHILQKHRLAIAIAIVKNTPENCTPREHLDNLRKVILAEMDSFDPDMTICEDDFNLDDDYTTNDNTQANNNNKMNEAQYNDSQTNDSVTILKDFDFNEMIRNTEFNNNGDHTEMELVPNVLRILKGVDDGEMFGAEALRNNSPSNNLNHTQSTFYQSSQGQTPQTISLHENTEKDNNLYEASYRDTLNSKPKDLDNNKDLDTVAKENVTGDSTYYDSQKTIIYTLHGFTDNYTHVSQSQPDNIVVPRYLLDKRTKDSNSKASIESNMIKYKDTDNKIANTNQNVNLNKCNANVDQISNENQNFNTNLIQSIGNKQMNNNNDNLKVVHEKTDSKLPEVINTKIKEGKKHKNSQENLENIESKRSRNNSTVCETDKAYFSEIKNQFNNNLNVSTVRIDKNINNINAYNRNTAEKELKNASNIKFDDSQNSIKANIERNTNKSAYNSQKSFHFSQEFESEEQISNSLKDKQNPDKLISNNITNKELIEEPVNISDEEKEEMFDKLTESQIEVVPFKVLEELSKIKNYLNRTDRRNIECVSDSGYKSDSQSRSSFKTLHSSNWLNQSAHTLMSFIIQCPLVNSTKDITNDISRTLGHLIDRLHQDEKYPSFLEEHLEAVEGLIKGIFEEKISNELLKKEECIHRLLLLNKSSHIIKFSIDKIINILEDTHTKLSTDKIYEITHTDQAENLAYIFHILEIFIKKLMIFKNVSSQNSTQSQDDEIILKKSSITDIWRKKWNYTKKVETNVSPKQDVLVLCSDVLNKIIVQAMDGYSLISFYALQCFNLLQN